VEVRVLSWAPPKGGRNHKAGFAGFVVSAME
jgi:hypothetical protein